MDLIRGFYTLYGTWASYSTEDMLQIVDVLEIIKKTNIS